ncbi:MAG: ATP-binding protein [Deltaproteobacteria bacterium]|jgi:predicted AAA+ superfamily ATPase|nr:ATP-binding protein [Deltaproteobacteria bacterium]
MEYISRHLERKFLLMSKSFKAVLVTGARQVGKTTMLRHLAEGQNRSYVSLDSLKNRQLARTDPELFFQRHRPPVIIDEAQHAPELFPQIKVICDESEDNGLFWLTGSQHFGMMERVRESLAGRVIILVLHGLSQTEKAGVVFGNEMDFSFPCLQARQQQVPKNDLVDVFRHIWRGGMPKALLAAPEETLEYFESYISSFLMKDVGEFGRVTDSLRFGAFLTACAALVGRQVNYKTLADAAGVSQPTAKDWLLLLEGLGIVHLMRPYYNNALKRLTKAPKLYFCDTGLAAFLTSWLTPETLMDGAANGYFFENYVVAELLKSYSVSPEKPKMTYFRDSNSKEIDVFIEKNNFIHPLEIKLSGNPDIREVKKFSVLEKTAARIGTGGIVCMCEDPFPIDRLNSLIPCNLI